MEKKTTPRIIMGVIIAGILMALELGLRKFSPSTPDGVRYMSGMVICFAGVLATCLLFIKQSGGALSFGEVFAHGFRTTAVIAFLMAVFTFVAVKWVYPPPGPAEMEAAVKAIEQQGNTLHQEAVQMAAQAAEKRWVVYVSIAIFATLIPGVLASVLGGSVAKKKL